MNLNDNKFHDNCVYVIPSDLTIKCNDFVVQYRDQYNSVLYGKTRSLRCEGTIICADEFKIDNLGEKITRIPIYNKL